MIYLNLPEVSGANKEIGQNMGSECQPTKTNHRPAEAGIDKFDKSSFVTHRSLYVLG